jgi:hypothetical protein
MIEYSQWFLSNFVTQNECSESDHQQARCVAVVLLAKGQNRLRRPVAYTNMNHLPGVATQFSLSQQLVSTTVGSHLLLS